MTVDTLSFVLLFFWAFPRRFECKVKFPWSCLKFTVVVIFILIVSLCCCVLSLGVVCKLNTDGCRKSVGQCSLCLLLILMHESFVILRMNKNICWSFPIHYRQTWATWSFKLCMIIPSIDTINTNYNHCINCIILPVLVTSIQFHFQVYKFMQASETKERSSAWNL